MTQLHPERTPESKRDRFDRLPHIAGEVAHLRQDMQDARLRARAYARQHDEDDPRIAGWRWNPVSEVAPEP